MRRSLSVLVLLTLLLAACGGGTPTDSGTDAAGAGDAEDRAMPAAEPSAMGDEVPAAQEPPAGATSEFRTDFSQTVIDYSEVLSGGPPKDGIPSIDDPQFVSIAAADEWIADVEPVVRVQVGEVARAYPLQILTWHEIVNDTVGDLPLMITFCPLCNTAIVFERTMGEQVLDFGTTGRLRFSNLIMYDRQTETWWQQATGEALAGELTGEQLVFYPAEIIAWSDFKAAHPAGEVLSRATGFDRPYGNNPYVGYDDVNSTPFAYEGPPTPGRLLPVERVLSVDLGGESVAYPYETLSGLAVVNDTVGGTDLVVFWSPGTASALDSTAIADGRDVGTATAFERTVNGQTLTFEQDGGGFRDAETGSTWDALGVATAGELAGTRLTPVVAVNHFWFSWAAFKPDTRVFEPQG